MNILEHDRLSENNDSVINEKYVIMDFVTTIPNVTSHHIFFSMVT